VNTATTLALSPRPPVAARYSRFAFEAFRFSPGGGTYLLDPLEAGTLPDALAETTARWAWDRGDRLAVREIGEGRDRLHVFAVRRKSRGTKAWQGYVPVTEHERWLEPVCVIDLGAVAGIGEGLVGAEVELHERRQRERPAGARLRRAKP
jgi:hypothetical protein